MPRKKARLRVKLPTYWTASEVAEKIGTTRQTIYRLSRLHDVGTDLAQQRLFTTSDVRDLRKLYQPGMRRV